MPPESKLVTGNKTTDEALGFFFVIGLLALFGIGLLVIPVTYLAVHKSYRYFTRGMNYGVGGVLLVILGMFAWCMVGVSGIR